MLVNRTEPTYEPFIVGAGIEAKVSADCEEAQLQVEAFKAATEVRKADQVTRPAWVHETDPEAVAAWREVQAGRLQARDPVTR